MALGKAGEEGIELEEDHWAVILALQEYFTHHGDSTQVNRRLLHDAVNEKFHHKGALLICTGCFSGAPIAQGCRLAGLEAPPRQCGSILRQHLMTAYIFNPRKRRRCTAGRLRTA